MPGRAHWEGLPPLAEVGPTWEHDTPLRTERARRAALVEIDALVAVWLGMDVDALIAIYHAAFPVLNRYEEITWFDANGWKLAGYHRTYGQIQQKSSYERVPGLPRGPGEEPAPGRLHAALLQGGPDGGVPAGACGVQ